MAMKKAVQARVAARKQAVGRMRAKGVDAATARKRNYVRTRAAELEAQGKTVDRAALRKKFESGQVSRAGFYKAGEKAALRKKSAGTKSSGPKMNVGDAKDRMGQKPKASVGDAKDRMKSRKVVSGPQNADKGMYPKKKVVRGGGKAAY